MSLAQNLNLELYLFDVPSPNSILELYLFDESSPNSNVERFYLMNQDLTLILPDRTSQNYQSQQKTFLSLSNEKIIFCHSRSI